MPIFERTLSSHLLRLARQYPVITLTGPRQAGKTFLCRYLFSDYDYINLEDLSLRERAQHDPKTFLAGFPNGVILDEIQRVPDLPSYIQLVVDDSRRQQPFILTGSQQFEVTQSVNQSLAGRTAIARLLPLSYSEYTSQRSSPLGIDKLLYQGFYPRILAENLNPTEASSFYLSTYVERDLRQLVNLKDLQTFERFLRVCATNVGQLVNYTQLGNDCGISQNTVKHWLSMLEASYILYFVQPHFKNFRKRLIKSPKLYFYDVGLASFLLNIRESAHVATHPLRGHLFENFIVSEFLKNRFHRVKENNLYFFRDQSGLEIDLILDDGERLTSVEIKSSATFSEDFLRGLSSYQKIAAHQNKRQILIYGGDQSFMHRDVHVYGYGDLARLFEVIE